jgi:DNA-binding Xre family transcriptional regulator
MIRAMSYQWHLRTKMAERGMFATSDLIAPLADRGVQLSREQIYRIVTAAPQRLSMDVLAALCDILDCTPNDLIEVVAQPRTVAKTAGSGKPARPQPRRTTIRRPSGG